MMSGVRNGLNEILRDNTPQHRYFNKRDILKNCSGFITESEGMISSFILQESAC